MGLPWRVLLVCASVVRSSCHVDHSEDSDGHDHRTMYINEWGVEIHGGEENARAVAEATGFIYVSPVGSLDNFHTLTHPNVPERHHLHAADKTATLHGHGEVRWAEQQKILRRSKRSVQPRQPKRQTGQQRNVPLSATAGLHGEPYPSPQDPSWPLMWYHHRRYQDPRPVWHRGFTGRGVVVSVLDDGIDYTHPDLKLPYDAQASYDFNDGDADPMPRPTFDDENRHGTRCAGEVSATMNNDCIVGAAYNSSIGGVRMLDGPITDTVEGNSLSFHPQHIDIYSNSWGPDDDGLTLDGPAKQTQAALQIGAEKGRGGLGSIFVWAAGNGGSKGDSCGCDGYTDNIYTISISVMSQLGDSPWYAERCASTMATTYSSGSSTEQQIVTDDLHHACTSKHTGTSAAAPMAAGLLALALEANPKLTWRDTQHIIALASQSHPPDVLHYNPSFWSRNGAGHLFSHEFGFGLMDPAGMTNLAQHWTRVPEMKTCLEQPFNINKNLPGTFTFNAMACAGTVNEVRYAENVVAIITVSSPLRGGLKFDLTSPMGTTSNLLPLRPRDRSTQGFDGWRFLTVFNWGENPKGKWKFSVESSTTVQVRSFQLEIYGTTQPPAILKLPEMDACHTQCYDGCIGLSSADCHSCKELTVFKRDGSFDCVGGSECPTGFDRVSKTCRPCASTDCWRSSCLPFNDSALNSTPITVMGINSTINVSCATNYKILLGSLNITSLTCQANGTWSTLPNCVASCLPFNDSALNSTPITVMDINSTINVSCATNYKILLGSLNITSLTCQANGTWSTLPNCVVRSTESKNKPPTIILATVIPIALLLLTLFLFVMYRRRQKTSSRPANMEVEARRARNDCQTKSYSKLADDVM